MGWKRPPASTHITWGGQAAAAPSQHLPSGSCYSSTSTIRASGTQQSKGQLSDHHPLLALSSCVQLLLLPQLVNCLEGAEALQRWPLRFALLKCSRARNDRVIHRQEQRGQQCSTEGQHHFGSSTASTPSSRSPWPSSWQSTPREGGTGFSMHSTAAPHSAPSETRSFSQRTGTGDTPLLAAAWAGSNAQPREV